MTPFINSSQLCFVQVGPTREMRVSKSKVSGANNSLGQLHQRRVPRS
jgi:hypothetical protein